jgi:hypothetical protein
MSSEAPLDGELLEHVRRLRADGMSVKQIARALGEKPKVVAPLVRAVAAEEHPETSDPDEVRCWVSPGWSSGLSVRDHPDWRDIDDPDQGPGGVAAVLVARRHRTNRFSACGYLVDTHCLGVKDVLGPRILSDRNLPSFVALYFDAFEAAGPPLRAPLELARHLVHGGIEAASRLGFEPCRDFAEVADHLGPWHGESAITFGKNGAPFYVAGPYDDARSVLDTLTSTVGDGNFTFVVPVGPVR